MRPFSRANAHAADPQSAPSVALSTSRDPRVVAPTCEVPQIIAMWEADATVLRRRGEDRIAQVLEQCARDVHTLSDDFTTWLSEVDAATRAGWTTNRVRRHARAFAHTPHVTRERGVFRLRACIVPRQSPVALRRSAITPNAQEGR